ncbi:hypothetical protein BE221DRAFT_163209, partial [Ostreococcus tauri]
RRDVFVLTSWYELVRAGTSWYELVRAGTSWYELVRAGTSWYELVRAGTSWYGGDESTRTAREPTHFTR